MFPISKSWLPLPLALLAGACQGAGRPEAEACEIQPGDAVQISDADLTKEKRGQQQGPAYYFELQIGINPKDSSNLVASGILTHDTPDSLPQEVVAFRSGDGGKTWARTPLPPFPLVNGKRPFGGDPTVLFSKAGTAMYLTYTTPNSAHLSTDGGKTWSEPVAMTPTPLDHWMVAADMTNGPRGGSVYAWGMGTVNLKKDEKPGRVDYNFIQYQMRLLRSKDEGKTWTDKLAVTNEGIGIKGHGLNSVSDILVATNGRLYLPFHSWDNLNDKGERGQWLVTSEDGGETFTTPHKLTKAGGGILMGPKAGSYPGFALDVTPGPFKNRLYVVWMDSTAASGRWQLLFSSSDDGGATFVEPTVMQDSLIPMDNVHPDLQVDDRGVLLVGYYHFETEGPDSTTNEGDKLQDIVYNRYVTASLNGGKTFLPAKPLASSKYRSPARYSPNWGWGLSSTDLGDYFNIAKGPDGAFHAIWMGGQGPTHMWYAPIRVECDGKPAAARAE